MKAINLGVGNKDKFEQITKWLENPHTQDDVFDWWNLLHSATGQIVVLVFDGRFAATGVVGEETTIEDVKKRIKEGDDHITYPIPYNEGGNWNTPCYWIHKIQRLPSQLTISEVQQELPEWTPLADFIGQRGRPGPARFRGPTDDEKNTASSAEFATFLQLLGFDEN